MFFKRSIHLIKRFNCGKLFYSTTAVHGGFRYIPKFNGDDERKILEVLNGSNAEELSRFDVSQMRIKSLESYKNKKGPFKSITEILEVEGLGVKNLERLCESIITKDDKVIESKVTNGSNKNRRSFLTPTLPADVAFTLSSAVGLHLDPTGISWAKMLSDKNELFDWNYFNFSELPNKMLPHDTFNLAMTILSKIPTGDLYIFEAPPSLNPVGGQKQSIQLSYAQNLELVSMLLALINTSSKHNLDLLREDQLLNRVYFLRSKLPARLFRTLVGNERVSSYGTVDRLLSNESEPLPCTKVDMNNSIKNFYQSQSTACKDLLGQALLIAVTFMDLCLYKNQNSINVVSGRRKKE